ncbi:VOC family protein [Aeromonas sp. MdU4]|uniref:VOC family protein n=1 Tax=Aeromonas sp. MdU4 TaxID=3342819 RepID=UPI0035B6FFD3
MKAREKLNYVEFAARDLAATKAFFQTVFGWQFVDYGPDYCAFADEGLDGGFYKADLCSNTAQGGALLVFYSADIAATQSKVVSAGGSIVRPLFDFPGGRRFHFTEPSGNEFAVWSEE